MRRWKVVWSASSTTWARQAWGASYHADPVQRAAREVPGHRTAIIDRPLALAIDETRRFRHIARKNYNMVQISEAGRALGAAAIIHKDLIDAINDFRSKVEGD